MKRQVKDEQQQELIGTVESLKTAICVPAIREEVQEWRKSDYRGATDITKELLYYWFESDHKLPNGNPFRFHNCQREAIESLIYVWEVAKTRKRWDLYEHFRYPTAIIPSVIHDDFPRYCIKMATGSGKTIVMALAVVWQYFNAVSPDRVKNYKEYSKTFLVIAPNVIVFERLKLDFHNGKIFKDFQMIPNDKQIYWVLDCIMRGEGERPHSEGVLLLTNIQQLYESRKGRKSDEPEEMTGVLGPALSDDDSGMDFNKYIKNRGLPVLILNDEAHHTHDDENEWNKVIRKINSEVGISMQLDFTATPRYQKGQLFPWTISDYPIKQAIADGIVKRPLKGITDAEERPSNKTVEKYQYFLTAAVERWREYKTQLEPLNRKPVLFIMMNDTKEAKDVADWLRATYSSDFAGDKTQEIHVELRGENAGQVSNKDLEKARKLVREIDHPDNPINAIVSVLMLREGWDVTVVLGLRPYTSRANILPEQTIGRGLRLMFRGEGYKYKERVDVIGNRAFLDFVEELEREEDIKFETFQLGRDRFHIVIIRPEPNKTEFDIGIPILTPLIVRKKDIREEIALIDVMELPISQPLEPKNDTTRGKEFPYEAFDVLTKELVLSRKYRIEELTTPQEVIGYWTELLATELHLPAHFAALYPKVRDFFEHRAFGRHVDLFDRSIVNAISENSAGAMCIKAFKCVLGPKIISQKSQEVIVPAKYLSSLLPFPWSGPTLIANKCIFNKVPCDNEFELKFASFLDNAREIKSFSKLPINFGFSIEYLDNKGNMRNYYPDFVVIGDSNIHYLIETKGIKDENVYLKDKAASLWCENASKLTNKTWCYIRVDQEDFNNIKTYKFKDILNLLKTNIIHNA